MCKPLHQRQLYISRKGRQLDAITDAHKYSRRLARIMRYHKLLTDAETSTIRKWCQEYKTECQHKNSETIPIRGTDETICICHDCGKEL